MTRKDYELIAAVVRKQPAVTLKQTMAKIDLANDFADVLAMDNPRFKREVFIEAATGFKNLVSAGRP